MRTTPRWCRAEVVPGLLGGESMTTGRNVMQLVEAAKAAAHKLKVEYDRVDLDEKVSAWESWNEGEELSEALEPFNRKPRKADAPVLLAYPAGEGRWKVWCDDCNRWHFHGAGEGHRAAHCDPDGYYDRSGYYIVLSSKPAPRRRSS